MLRNHRRAQLEDRVKAVEWPDEHDLVFTSRTGHPIDSSNLRWLVSDIAKHAQLGRLTPYDLRHSATSILSEAGVRNEHLADLLGHVDTRMVERHYRHQLADFISVAVVPMAGLFAAG